MELNTIGLIIYAVFNTIASIATLIGVLRTHKLTHQIELATNSMKDALVKSTSELAHAEGVAQGRADAKAENKSDAKEIAVSKNQRS